MSGLPESTSRAAAVSAPWLQPRFRVDRLPATSFTNPGSGYTSAPTVTVGASHGSHHGSGGPEWGLSQSWPTDGRDGGVPDPDTAGPNFIQIGNEGGILPGVAVRDNQPVNYDYDRGSATVLNVRT